MWPNERFIKLSGIELPVIQAPMAGAAFSDMVVAVAESGGLGSLACALLTVEQARKELENIPEAPRVPSMQTSSVTNRRGTTAPGK